MDSKELGNLGEKIACEYLVKKGYKILAKNYRITFGEIDIIAKKKRGLLNFFLKKSSVNSGRVIHFVEVKTIVGANDSFFPEEKVNYKKQNKLRKLCLLWLEKNRYPQNYPYQIDIIGILVNQNSRKANLHYFQNVVEDTDK